ncbi:MAG: hypothetical protein J07HR59_01113 [Halorubrum sp. J07HR59]|nr:MAG: hypothetical protein J07HR59_01113 [Halorubrum sp. J07HR59]
MTNVIPAVATINRVMKKTVYDSANALHTEKTPTYARTIAKIVGAPNRSESHPVRIRPNGANQIAALANTPISASERPNSSAIGPVNGANENQMRNEKLNPIVARSNVRYFVILIGLFMSHAPADTQRF